jgi:pimeloyl-ACP methyl ester carboxylesterase
MREYTGRVANGVDMSGLTLHAEDRGAGSPSLVFLHYFAGSLQSWAHVSGALSSTCRCLSVDLPGFGCSPPLPAYSVHAVAQVVARFIADLRLDSYVLVGHSMGGKLALACAAARPPGLAGLVLVAPSPPSPEPMDESERNRLLASHGDHASAEQTLHTITRRSLPAEDVAACIADNLLTSPEAWRWWLAQGSREDITALAGQVTCPVLVLSGSDDPVIAPSVIEDDVMPRLADAARIEITGVGHLLPLEATQEVAGALRTFVAQRCHRADEETNR